MKFNKNNKNHIEVLNFIGRWKRITSAMLNIQFKKSNRSYWKLLLDSMKHDGLIKEVKSALKTAGKPATLYYLTQKGADLTNLGYKPCLERDDATHINKINHELQILKLVKEVLKLEDDQFLTDYELFLRWKKLGKSLKMRIQPRLCDFAYFDKDGQLIGCEVELNLKSHNKYIDKEWGFGYALENNVKGPISCFAYINKQNRYVFLPKDITKHKMARLWIKEKKGLTDVKLLKMHLYAFKDGEVEHNDKGQWVDTHSYTKYVWASNLYNAKRYFFNHIKKKFKLNGTWHTNLIEPTRVFRVKKQACIWEKQNYALDHNFYKKVIWYLPDKEFKLFTSFVKKTYKENKWEDESRVQIKNLNEVKNEQMNDSEFNDFLSSSGGYAITSGFYVTVDNLIRIMHEHPNFTLKEAIAFIIEHKDDILWNW